MNDLIAYNRATVAHAYRRLADAAVRAAEVYADPTKTPDVDASARRAVTGAVASVTHARTVYAASIAGSIKADLEDLPRSERYR